MNVQIITQSVIATVLCLQLRLMLARTSWITVIMKQQLILNREMDIGPKNNPTK